jgi:triosephosphate isomerase
VAGNWKMHGNPADGASLAGQIVNLLAGAAWCEVAVFPPFTGLAAAAERLRGSRIHLGAQNLHPEPKGAFTGEVAGSMLAALGCRFVIVGHSERRHGLGEDDALVARKLRAAHRDGLTPVVCVGETLEERDAGRAAEVVVRQVRACFDGLGAATARASVVAYEPVWAIGTGRVASPEQAGEAHALIRATLDRVVEPGVGKDVTVLYGGSVKADNAPELFAVDDIDGALVGGASLEPASFTRIVGAAHAPARG